MQMKAEDLTADGHCFRSIPGIKNNIPSFSRRQKRLSSSGYMDYKFIESLYSFCSLMAAYAGDA